MLIEFLIAAIIIGVIRGGSIAKLISSSFNKMIVLILALIIYMSFIHFAIRGYDLLLDYSYIIYIVVNIILLVAIVLNYKYREVWLICIGLILNIISFVANDQNIIFSGKGLSYIGLEDAANLLTREGANLLAPLTDATNASVLSHFIAIPKPYIYPQIFSIGDLLISLGVFLLIQTIMFNQDIGNNKMLNFRYRG
ncbi:DUF5317 family protein [Sporosalibacterium faouarense]|uniref:DUF5317 family protein n=1 Tax=Sporosalibacterium faouarense TaxID=516123 RepID=UPI00192B6DCB|nr:DUF5317 family protein [Sporosalibacterium faouarense]